MTTEPGHRTKTAVVDGPRIRDLPTGVWEFVTIDVRQSRMAMAMVDEETGASQTVCRAAQAGADTPGKDWIVDGVSAEFDPVEDHHILRFTFRRRPTRLALIRRRLGW